MTCRTRASSVTARRRRSSPPTAGRLRGRRRSSVTPRLRHGDAASTTPRCSRSTARRTTSRSRVVDHDERRPVGAGHRRARSSAGATSIRRATPSQSPARGRRPDHRLTRCCERVRRRLRPAVDGLRRRRRRHAGSRSRHLPGRLGRPAARPRRRAPSRSPGVISRRGVRATDPALAGHLRARRRREPLNSWVHEQHPRGQLRVRPRAARQRAGDADLDLATTPRAPDYFTTFRWDLDGDGDFDDATGKSVTHDLPDRGRARGRASRRAGAGGDKATAYFAFNVGADPNAPPAQLAPPPTAPPTPPAGGARSPRGSSRRSTRPSARRSQRGRFNISVRFARTAPAGHRGRRGLPRQAQDRHRARPRPPRRHAPDQRQAHADGPAAAGPQRHQAPEAQGAGARRAQRAALEDADGQALSYRIERYRSSSQGVTWTR